MPKRLGTASFEDPFRGPFSGPQLWLRIGTIWGALKTTDACLPAP